MSKFLYSYYFAKYSAEKLATLGTHDKGRRQTKQETQHRKLKRWETRIRPKTWGEPRRPRRTSSPGLPQYTSLVTQIV